MKIATPDIRRTVVEAYQKGKATKKQLADIFGFHISAISRWIRIAEEENRYAPLKRGHKKPIFSKYEQKLLVKLVEEKPDITLAEIREHFSKKCSLTSIYRTLRALGFLYLQSTNLRKKRVRYASKNLNHKI